MLIEFSVENFLSFREKRVLSMEATGLSESPENAFETTRYKLLKSAVIYGANSSGKSNLIKAFEFMAELISVFHSSHGRYKVNFVHLLRNVSEKKAAKFEVVFLLNEKRYRYGFEILNTYAVSSEWLFVAEKTTERLLFQREGQEIQVNDKFSEGRNLEERTREDRLFLSVVSQFNGSISNAIIQWFSSIHIISALEHLQYVKNTYEALNDGEIKKAINDFYSNLTLGFKSIELNEGVDMIDEGFSYSSSGSGSGWGGEWVEVNEDFNYNPETTHTVYSEDNKALHDIKFSLRQQESAGTNKLFNLSGSLFYTLRDGGIMVVDEMDASLHPLILLAITRLFNSDKANPKNAQLIFTTHDTNLLHYGSFRRDQIWFCEKDKYGGTDLYSLAEIKEMPRKGADFEQQYIQGRYGAIPYIGNLEKLFTEWQKQGN